MLDMSNEEMEQIRQEAKEEAYASWFLDHCRDDPEWIALTTARDYLDGLRDPAMNPAWCKLDQRIRLIEENIRDLLKDEA